MSIQGIYILDKKGNVLITRNYKLEVQDNVVDKFIRKQMEQTDKSYSPFLVDEENEVVYTSYNHKNIVLVVLSDQNEDGLLLLEFLAGFVELMRAYFLEVEEESIKDNFVIIYELLDEVVDNGYVQCLDVNFLKDYIKTDYHELVRPERGKDSRLLQGPRLENKITWRAEGIRHAENEFFMDVYEHVSFLCDLGGNVSRSEVRGVIRANSKLSGMPVVEMGLNEKAAVEGLGLSSAFAVEFQHVQFHKCVDLLEYEEKNKIFFTPPDGEFELLTYFIKQSFTPLFTFSLEPLKQGKSAEKYLLTVLSNFKQKSIASNLLIQIPTPCDAIDFDIKQRDGTAEFNPKNDLIEWKVPFFKGENLISLEFGYRLPSLVSRKLTSQLRGLPRTAHPRRFLHSFLHSQRTQRPLHEDRGRLRI